MEATAEDDPFADASGARLAKTTLHSRLMAWRGFLGFLTITDPGVLELAPMQRVNPERLRTCARHLGETNTPYSVACQIDSLYGAVRLLLPRQDWIWLRQLKKRLFAAAPPARRGPVITSIQLLELGLELMAESKVVLGRSLDLDSTILYRDGLMIAFLTYIPLRHRNFGALEIGRDLFEEDERWFIIISSSETKTNVPIEFDIPRELEIRLRTYLDVVRPKLLRSDLCKALWVRAL